MNKIIVSYSKPHDLLNNIVKKEKKVSVLKIHEQWFYWALVAWTIFFSESFNMGKNYCMSLRACKSRELRGGILYTDCYCLRRNGLQYDCRRSGCIAAGNLCRSFPAPLCEPARVACMSHCANPHAEALSAICKMRSWYSQQEPNNVAADVFEEETSQKPIIYWYKDVSFSIGLQE